MNLKDGLKKFVLTKPLYHFYRRYKEQKHYNNSFSYHGQFIDRSNGYEKLCIILAGYKEFAYAGVFGRVKRFITDDIDVCVITSGLYSDTIAELCEKNNWSYLYTMENNVSLVQNIAIKNHKNAKYIYKLDEDVFLTEGYFDKMMSAYNHACDGDFNPGVIAPLLLVNGYAHVRILKQLGVCDIYEKNFERIKYAAGVNRQIESNPDVAKFMWGEGGVVPSIDTLNKMFGEKKLNETACPIRFSIGAVMFERELWENMGYFEVRRKGYHMGKDEEQLCSYCCLNSRPIMVSDNIVVGHLSFGTQNMSMKEYYLEHKDKFL